MINYIKSEVYRIYTSTSIYILLGILIGFSTFMNILDNCSRVKRGAILHSVQYIYGGLSEATIIIFIAIYAFSVIVVHEYSKNTFKNIISSELSRKKIYLGKLIVTNLIIISIYLIFVIVNTIVLLFLYKVDSSLTLSIWFGFIERVLFSIPLLMGLSSLGCFMAFLLRKEALFSTIYILLFAFFNEIIYMLTLKFKCPKIGEISDYTISINLRRLAELNINNTNMIKFSLVGVWFILIFGILGYLVFRKQDIK